MKRLLFAAIVALSLAVFAAPVSAHGGPGGGHHGGAGDLDPTWQGTGYSTTSFPGVYSFADGVAAGRGGSVVAVGGLWDGTGGDFAIARYRHDGSLDPSFGNGGRVVTDFKGGTDLADAVAFEGDKLVVVGYTSPSDGTFSFALARYLKNGDLDPTFGKNGKVVTTINGYDFADAVVVQYGKIIVAGATAANGSENDFVVARYNNDGSLDTTFNGTGWVTTDFNGGDDSANAVALVHGRILVAGSARGTMRDFGLVRYRWNGSLDTSFGVGGKVTTDFAGGDDDAHALDVSGGRIVVIGSADNGNDRDFAAAVYNRRGNLDPRFGTDGRATMDLGKDDVAYGGGFGPNGSVVAGGNSADGLGTFALVRWTRKGLPDLRFGGGLGHVTTAIGTDSSGLAMAQTFDGKLVLAGFADSDFAMARYLGDAQRGGFGGGFGH